MKQMTNHPNRSRLARIIDSTYIGPDAALRDDPAFQMGRAKADLEFAIAMANDAGRTRIAAKNRAIGQDSYPVIKARIAALST